MTRFIGLGGHLGAGKDAVADYLVQYHDFTKIGMSDRLLVATLAANPYIRVTLREALRLRFYVWPGFARARTLVSAVGYVDAKTVKDFRHFMQKFGTEAGRDVHGENVWVDLIAKDIRALLDDGQNVVLTGVRFPNEVDMANSIGETWYVNRPGHDGSGGGKGHSSESISAAHFHRLIRNDGSLDDLRRLVSFTLREPQHNAFAHTDPAPPYLIG
ncbi:hypothetical protein [Leifsonia aquatica]|uniref:deoxynucleotide monophosphate kinase family protein n=1 Tax=Leifsonia aquatica TaxID=144185 RepID=UPI000468799E|nr:hypothetical protein [Leifsonia aquatica]